MNGEEGAGDEGRSRGGGKRWGRRECQGQKREAIWRGEGMEVTTSPLGEKMLHMRADHHLVALVCLHGVLDHDTGVQNLFQHPTQSNSKIKKLPAMCSA